MEAVLPGENEDDRAMARLAAGDSAALADLFERHRGPLFGFLLRLVGDRCLAEDLLGETFLRVYRGRRNYRAGRGFVPWLLTIARRLAIGELRKHRVRALFLQHVQAPPPPDTGAWDGEQEALQASVQAALRALPHEQRLALVLREYQELSYREIAQVLGCSEQAARARTYRARLALRDLLKEVV